MSALEILYGPEEWRDVPGHVGYQASTWGRVRSVDRGVQYAASWKAAAYTKFKKGCVLRPHRRNTGHLQVVLVPAGSMDVHVIVALTFHGPKPAGCEVLHLDHRPGNNTPGNLRWGTRSENILMDYENGVGRRFKRKLTLEQVEHIRRVYPTLTERGQKAALARSLGVTNSAVGNIASGVARQHG